MFHYDCTLALKPASRPRRLVHKKLGEILIRFHMLLSAVSVLVVPQPSWEFPEGLMDYLV
jgi:hypothetical protein